MLCVACVLASMSGGRAEGRSLVLKIVRLNVSGAVQLL